MWIKIENGYFDLSKASQVFYEGSDLVIRFGGDSITIRANESTKQTIHKVIAFLERNIR